MIEESARVIEIQEGRVLVETSKNSTCAACSAKSGCTTGMMAEMSPGKTVQVSVDNPEGLLVSVGDQVQVGVETNSFLTASSLLYLLPLATLFAGAYWGQLQTWSEPATAVAGITGLVLGLVGVRLIGQRLGRSYRYQPVLLRVL